MRYDSWEEVRRQPPEEQRRVLRRGDPPEQVWAAWAIGVALGPDAIPDLRAALREARAQGVRRHLAWMLASLGARGEARRLAREDPDPLVRLTACKSLLATWAPGEDEDLRLAERTLEEVEGPARLEILQAWPAHGPAPPADRILAGIEADGRRRPVRRGEQPRRS
ncbi:MAG: HEAT repeat domain-containing protein [Myxococcota bacterium]